MVPNNVMNSRSISCYILKFKHYLFSCDVFKYRAVNEYPTAKATMELTIGTSGIGNHVGNGKLVGTPNLSSIKEIKTAIPTPDEKK